MDSHPCSGRVWVRDLTESEQVKDSGRFGAYKRAPFRLLRDTEEHLRQ